MTSINTPRGLAAAACEYAPQADAHNVTNPGDRFRVTRQRRRLRRQLLAENQHCLGCGIRLQGDDVQRADYAHIIHTGPRLSCRNCIRAVRGIVTR